LQVNAFGAVRFPDSLNLTAKIRSPFDQQTGPFEHLLGRFELVGAVNDLLLTEQEQACQAASLDDSALSVLAGNYRAVLISGPAGLFALQQIVPVGLFTNSQGVF